MSQPMPESFERLIDNFARVIEQRDAMLDILEELIADVESNGVTETEDEWFDVYVTYKKAKAFVS